MATNKPVTGPVGIASAVYTAVRGKAARDLDLQHERFAQGLILHLMRNALSTEDNPVDRTKNLLSVFGKDKPLSVDQLTHIDDLPDGYAIPAVADVDDLALQIQWFSAEFDQLKDTRKNVHRDEMKEPMKMPSDIAMRVANEIADQMVLRNPRPFVYHPMTITGVQF